MQLDELKFPLTAVEFAEQVANCSADSIRADVRAGKIQHHRRGDRGWLFFTREDAEAYLTACLVPVRRPT